MAERIMVHEWVFGLYLLVMTVGLVAVEGFADPDTLVFAGLVAVNVGVIAACVAKPGIARWRVRLGYYAVAMNVAFQQMRTAVPALRDWRADDTLRQADAWLFGDTPSVLIEPWMAPWLSDVMSICYFLFLPYLAISLVWYLFSPLALALRFYTGLFALYGVGFLGYLCVPAAGPYLAMQEAFSRPIEGSWITSLNAAVIGAGSNGTDVFPSLHVAVSCYLLFFDRRFKPWRFRIYLVPCVGLWASTVYLRYHYFVDLLAGYALAAASLWIAFRYFREDNHEIHPALR
jgi:membrane-associated phospholipid phosphatase